MVNKFIEISKVPSFKRRAAQERARREGKPVVMVSTDLFRVGASSSFYHPESPMAIEGRDFYPVQFFESNGSVFAVCGCPFGQKGDDDENTICKHIEAAFAERSKLIIARPAPVFANGKVVIDVFPNELSVTVTRSNSFGATTSDKFKVPVYGRGETALNNVIASLRSGRTSF